LNTHLKAIVYAPADRDSSLRYLAPGEPIVDALLVEVAAESTVDDRMLTIDGEPPSHSWRRSSWVRRMTISPDGWKRTAGCGRRSSSGRGELTGYMLNAVGSKSTL
jgi:hypothetical protein